MKFNSHYFTFGIMGLLAGAFWFYYGEYRGKAEEYHNLKLVYDGQVIAINEQQERIQHLTELNTKHTQELAHAKTEIDTLRADVAAGRRKLRIKATCPVSETVTSGSVVDSTTVELTGETGSTVLDIREGIINDRAKLRYLQDYVNTECRGNNG
ncbi:lysis protein [Xenorhabdus ishibashii]|uniref:Peptidase n=1 Tax=Xenorhabdus ishibashii TaxID=1034471 RepID=A0A2D0KCN5_9GAMM|nr:lysis protein [Xenorhabdus ishibashii]PHM60920.1 peptidase [Xenorhabdus ishibashii]PHM61209.1 peptidase [Xenorhabdus ishibashii]